MQKQEFSTEVGGQTLTATFSDLAEQANGSVQLSYGETTVLATAVMSEGERDIPFFPLVVDYEEKFYAAGSILGSRYMRREGRPSEEATLSSRLIDRTIRPLFDNRSRQEVQIVITVLSLGNYDPDILGINAASLALATSDIPWAGPVSAVRVALPSQDGSARGTTRNERGNTQNIIVNPSFEERADAEYEITVSGKGGTINMLEAGANQVAEDEIGTAFEHAIKEIEALEQFQNKIIAEIGKEKQEHTFAEISDEARALFTETITPKLPKAVASGKPGKEAINALKDEWMEMHAEQFPEENKRLADYHYEEMVDAELHRQATEENTRADGRPFDAVRNLYAQAGGVSPVLHGTGIFYRGGTHVLSALTLGGPRDALLVEGMEEKGKKRFMHHYNFPPFSAGETGRMGGANRRMIGHGALAERALSYVIPSQDTFPYTIRLVSESMASNGSTSMASICASTLALMDGGVPITAPVAGIAMGLMFAPRTSQIGADNADKTRSIQDTEYKILTDIQGPEDHFGDMDFKVAGTRNGVTALQLDIKTDGIPVSILKEALTDAKKARLHILDTIQEEIAEPRAELNKTAPRISYLSIPEDKIGLVIGPSGKTINKLKEDSGVDEINIEDDGSVFITGPAGTTTKAQEAIEEMTHVFTRGDKVTGTVEKILDFGAIVKISEYADGLLHISEIAPFHINDVKDVLKEGEQIPVSVKEVDDQGRMKLSLKDADPDFAKEKVE